MVCISFTFSSRVFSSRVALLVYLRNSCVDLDSASSCCLILPSSVVSRRVARLVYLRSSSSIPLRRLALLMLVLLILSFLVSSSCTVFFFFSSSLEASNCKTNSLNSSLSPLLFFNDRCTKTSTTPNILFTLLPKVLDDTICTLFFFSSFILL